MSSFLLRHLGSSLSSFLLYMQLDGDNQYVAQTFKHGQIQ